MPSYLGPAFTKIVIVLMENHDYNEIIGSSSAPYINGTLARNGTVFTNYQNIYHPSEPNYFAIYAGSDFGVTDDGSYSEPDPTMATALAAAGYKFSAYVESGSPQKHNPWESFPERTTVEKDFASLFPQTPSGFAALPDVSFVVPNLTNDMHDGTIGQGDTWLQANIDKYRAWAQTNNSLLIMVFDESDVTNILPCIFVGQGVSVGTTAVAYNHLNLHATVLGRFGLAGLNKAAGVAMVGTDVWAPIAVPTHTIMVRDHARPAVTGVSGSFTIGPAAAAGTLTIVTPSGVVTGSPVSLSGSYATATPVSIDYSIDGGSTWFALTSASISGGSWTGVGPTYTAPVAGAVITVRDHGHTTVTATTAAFAVTAPVISGAIPLTLTNMGTTPSVAGFVTHAHAFPDGFIPPGGTAVLTDSQGHRVTQFQQESQASWPSGSPATLVLRYRMAETLPAGGFVKYTIGSSSTPQSAVPAAAWGANPLATLAANTNFLVNFWGGDAGGTQAAPFYSVSVNDIIANFPAWGLVQTYTKPPAGTIIGGTGPDTLTLQMSEDAYQGDAQFSITIDGAKVGGTQTVTATHANGATQAFSVLGSFTAATHSFTVNFLNDAYGGSAALDLNLYLISATLNGAPVPGATINIFAPANTHAVTFGGPGSTAFTPVGQWELLGSGPAAMTWRFERYLKKN